MQRKATKKNFNSEETCVTNDTTSTWLLVCLSVRFINRSSITHVRCTHGATTWHFNPLLILRNYYQTQESQLQSLMVRHGNTPLISQTQNIIIGALNSYSIILMQYFICHKHSAKWNSATKKDECVPLATLQHTEEDFIGYNVVTVMSNMHTWWQKKQSEHTTS